MQAPDDGALIARAAQDAAAIALTHFKSDPQVWDKGAAGPVTEADLEVDAFLKDRLLGARPLYGWLSEETEDGTDRLRREKVFIVDPIDGTRAFIDGHSAWGISIAIATEGRITEAAIAMPVKELLYTATEGAGALRNGDRIHIAAPKALGDSTVLCAKPNLRADYWRAAPPPLTRHYRPSLAYRLALTAEGRFDTMLTLSPTWEWDVAAGCLLIEEAGGAVRTAEGQPTRFNSPRPKLPGILCGPGPTVDALLACGPKLP
ncbi:MAG: 3'(2'),5'-bisphosphate nucleotidase CysQ [Shimia sp.]